MYAANSSTGCIRRSSSVHHPSSSSFQCPLPGTGGVEQAEGQGQSKAKDLGGGAKTPLMSFASRRGGRCNRQNKPRATSKGGHIKANSQGVQRLGKGQTISEGGVTGCVMFLSW